MSWLLWALGGLIAVAFVKGFVDEMHKSRTLKSGVRKGDEAPKPSQPRARPNVRSARLPPSGVIHEWLPEGRFEFDVVGESAYQDALRRLAGQHGESTCREEVDAELVPEDGNEFDDLAVAVKVGGELVAYFSREDARSFRRRLAQKGLSDQKTKCRAMIVGGGVDKTGKAYHYGVRLDIKPFY